MTRKPGDKIQSEKAGAGKSGTYTVPVLSVQGTTEIVSVYLDNKIHTQNTNNLNKVSSINQIELR